MRNPQSRKVLKRAKSQACQFVLDVVQRRFEGFAANRTGGALIEDALPLQFQFLTLPAAVCRGYDGVPVRLRAVGGLRVLLFLLLFDGLAFPSLCHNSMVPRWPRIAASAARGNASVGA